MSEALKPRVMRVPDGGGPFVFTCEHAANEMHGIPVSAADRACLDDHWGFDPGAAALTRRLAAKTKSPAVLSNFSRLLIDPNREPESKTLFRYEADGHALSFNVGLTDADRQARIATYYNVYHDAVEEMFVAAARPVGGVSIHSFTQVYQGGPPRPMEIGVLFEQYEAEAEAVAAHLHDAGFVVALNEPWSGKGGLMYSIQSHGDRHGARHIEFEVRQDLLRDEALTTRVCDAIEASLRACFLPTA